MQPQETSRDPDVALNEDDAPEANVGRRVRAVRGRRGLSLRALAERSGLSVNTISLIERGENSPTVASLHLLAKALECPITEFFREATDDSAICVRREHRVHYRRGMVEVESLGAGLRDQQLEPFLLTVPAGQTNYDHGPITHSGQEFVHCMEGAVEYRIGDERYQLEAGDSLLFEAEQPHQFRNHASTDAVLLVVFSACDGSRNGRHQHLGT